MSVVPWTSPVPPIDSERLLRLQGYRDMRRVRSAVRESAVAAARESSELACLEGAWTRLGILALQKGDLSLERGLRLTCPAFPRLLAGCDQVIAFVLTAGTRLEEQVSSTFADDPVRSLFLESAGRLVLESGVRAMAGDLGRELARNGHRLGRRLGPGYSYRIEAGGTERGSWPLDELPTLFSAFHGVPIPAELGESGVMRPRLTRAGMFGVLRAALAAA